MSAAKHAPPAAVALTVEKRGRLAGTKARAVSVPVLTSTGVTCAVGALLPPVPGLALFASGLVIAGALLVDGMEPMAVRLLYGASPLTVADQRVLAPVLTALGSQGLGPPLLDIWIRPRGPATEVTATGRRSVLVTRALLEAMTSEAIGVERVTALLAREAGLVRAGATRFDPVLRWWTISWVLLMAGMVAGAQFFGIAAPVRVMWKARWLFAAIAVVQAVTADHHRLAVLVATIVVTTYLWPRWVRTWEGRLAELGDGAVARVCAPAPHARPGRVIRKRQGTPSAEAQARAPSAGRHLSVVR